MADTNVFVNVLSLIKEKKEKLLLVCLKFLTELCAEYLNGY